MRISIDSTEVNTKSGTGKNGKPYSIATQTAFVDTGKRYPAECRIRLADENKPWPVGEYTIDFEKSVFVGAYDRLTLSEEVVLVPMGEADKQASRPASARTATAATM